MKVYVLLECYAHEGCELDSAYSSIEKLREAYKEKDGLSGNHQYYEMYECKLDGSEPEQIMEE